jgi:hypothetical protein
MTKQSVIGSPVYLRQRSRVPSCSRPLMGIEFRERPRPEREFQFEVWKSGILLGHVRRDAGGFFQYYRGPHNELWFEFEDGDLERLKQRIASREAPAALTY